MHGLQDRLNTPSGNSDLVAVALRRYGIADVVGPGKQDDDLGIDPVEFSIVQSPEDVLSAIGAPTEVCRVPAEKVLFPVGQEFRIIRGPPAADDGIAFEVDVDAPALRLFQKLLMSDARILIRSRNRLIGGNTVG